MSCKGKSFGGEEGVWWERCLDRFLCFSTHLAWPLPFSLGLWYKTEIPAALGFPCSSVGKESACSAGDPGLIHGLGRCPGEGNGNPVQYSFLENPMDRGAWRATVHGAARVGHDLATKPSPAALEVILCL